jgi:hypothetical protein
LAHDKWETIMVTWHQLELYQLGDVEKTGMTSHMFCC